MVRKDGKHAAHSTKSRNKVNPFYAFLAICALLLLLSILVNIIAMRMLVTVEQTVDTLEEQKAVPQSVLPKEDPEVQLLSDEGKVLTELPPEASSKAPLVDPLASGRYASIIPYISEADIELVAAAVYQEANNQTFEGQQAVAEVIFNRILNKSFPNSVYDVLYQNSGNYWQFSTAPLLASTTPNQTNYDAVMAALYGPQVLDSEDVVFFARSPENSRIAAHIGEHYFCREYVW